MLYLNPGSILQVVGSAPRQNAFSISNLRHRLEKRHFGVTFIASTPSRWRLSTTYRSRRSRESPGPTWRGPPCSSDPFRKSDIIKWGDGSGQIRSQVSSGRSKCKGAFAAMVPSPFRLKIDKEMGTYPGSQMHMFGLDSLTPGSGTTNYLGQLK